MLPVFDFLKYNYIRPDYQRLLVSPHSSRPGLLAMINREIRNAREGYRAIAIIKCNNLVDRQLEQKLYEASRAGVEVRLIIRGMCSLMPGIEELSEEIEGISIVDRYLEHPRVYAFHNRGNPSYYIGSADLMTRNIDYRVEVLCPILDRDAQDQIQDILDQQWHDNVKARRLDAQQLNTLPRLKRKRQRYVLRSRYIVTCSRESYRVIQNHRCVSRRYGGAKTEGHRYGIG